MTERINVVKTGPSTRFALEADIIGHNVEGNYSTVRCYLAAYNGPSGNTSSQHGAYGLQTGSIDGIGEFARRESTPFLPSGYAQNAQRWRLGPYDVQVPHGADGTRGPVTLRMGLTYGGGGGTNESHTASLSGFSTIPRATTPTVAPASGSTGQTFTIKHTPAVSSFAHDIAYSLDGGATYVNIQTGVPGTDTSTDWTPAHSLLPNKTSVTAIVRVITRASAGGTVIGTKTVNVPLTVPASVKPAISSVAFADAQASGPDIPTLMGGAGRFVQRWSRLIPTITATGAGGSTVTESTVTQAGQTAKSGEAFGQPVTVSGNVPYSAIATDSRGRVSDPYANTVPVTAYNFPNLPTPLVTRTEDAAGLIPSPTGTYLAVTPGASVSNLIFDSVQKNVLEWRVRTRPVGGEWTTKQDWTSATVSGNTWIAKQVFATYPSSQEFEVEVSIRDLFGKNGFNTAQTVVTRTVPVPSEQVFMDWDGNEGIGVGGYRRYGKVDIHGDAHAERFLQNVDELVASVPESELADGVVPTWDEELGGWRAGAAGGGAGGGVPAGTILPYGGDTLPANAIWAEGQAVSRETYATLFAVYGTRYGAGNGTTTFNVPDTRGRSIIGLDPLQTEFNTLGKTGGAKTHTLSTAEMPSHAHPMAYYNGTGGDGAGNRWRLAAGVSLSTDTNLGGNVGGGQAHNNLPPYWTGRFIIVTANVDLPSDSVLATRVGALEVGVTGVPTPSAGVTIIGHRLTKKGNRVVCNLVLRFGSVPAVGAVVATLPEGFRPTIRTGAGSGLDNGGNIVQGLIDPDGQFRIYKVAVISGDVVVTGTWDT